MNKKQFKICVATAVVLGGVSLLPLTGLAQSASRYIERIAREELPRYSRVNTRGGALEPGNSVELSFRLRSGQKYGFVAVCNDADVNCTDIDLELLDANGNVIDSDSSDADYAVVVVDPSSTVVHELKVTMFGCNNSEGCQYSVGAYRK